MFKKSLYVLPLFGLLSSGVVFASEEVPCDLTLSQMRQLLGEQDLQLFALEEDEFDAICISYFGQPKQSPELKRNKVVQMSEEDQIAAFMAMQEDPEDDFAVGVSNSNIRAEQDMEYFRTEALDNYVGEIKRKIAVLAEQKATLVQGLVRYEMTIDEIGEEIKNLLAINMRRDPKSNQYQQAETKIKKLRTELALINSENVKISALEAQIKQLSDEIDVLKK